MKKTWFFIISLSIIILAACGHDDKPENTSTEPTPYTLKVPSHFPQPNLPADNPLTVEGVKLGRMLFYDPILSGNGRFCGACHLQKSAFMSPNSIQKLDPNLYQNIPSLSNLAWKNNYLWNGGATKLDLVPVADFGPLFFNSNLDTVLARLKRHPVYPGLFKTVFHGKDVINKDDIQISVSYAIAQYLRTMITANSKFDKYLTGKVKLNPSEDRGMMLFYTEKGDCFHCHSGVLLTDNQFHNIGLDDNFTGQNEGRYGVTHDPDDLGKFRSPSLRNVALTAPYMHDGRFKTLEDVIEHYNTGVKQSATLDPIMTKAGKESGLHLTTQDIADLKAFLQTFTDSSFITNPDFSNPF